MRCRFVGTILGAALVLGASAAWGAGADLDGARRDIAAMRYAEADRSLREIAQRSEGDEKLEALYRLAGLKKSAAEAEILYREISRMDPAGRWGVSAAVELAKIRFALGEYVEAASILAGTEACRRSDEACYFGGLAEVMLKRYEEARGHLSRIKSGRLRPWAEIALADADAGLDDPSAACKRYESMMRSPVAATAKYRYGECLEKEGDVAGARSIYEQVRSEYARTPEAILAGEKLEALRAGAREKSEAESGSAAPADGGDKPAAAGFTLQFGSFGDRANAIKLAAALKGKVPGVRIDSELVNFKEVHRVRSGYFKTRAEAERMAEEIARQTGENCAIMPLP
jgi:thioredoxin-like negative regulator of GroEL